MADQGYDKQVYEDGIVAYRIRSTARPNVDAWYQDVAAVFAQALEQNKPVRLMYDLRRIDLVTPYSV